MSFNPKSLITKQMLAAYVVIALGLCAAFGVNTKYVCTAASFFSAEPLAACVTVSNETVKVD